MSSDGRIGSHVLLSGPPGWVGAKLVRSYTLPLTNTQQSSGLACLSNSATETFELAVMFAGTKMWTCIGDRTLRYNATRVRYFRSDLLMETGIKERYANKCADLNGA